MLVGLVFDAQLAGTIMWLITEKESHAEEVSKHIDTVTSLMNSLELPQHIARSVTSYFEKTEATRQN